MILSLNIAKFKRNESKTENYETLFILNRSLIQTFDSKLNNYLRE
jgi:hypothetical protein